MRSRPRIVVRYESTHAVPGVPFLVFVELHARTETPIDFVEVRLVGERAVMPGAASVEFWEASQRIGPQRLTAGVRRLSASFVLPPDAPESFRSAVASVRYLVNVHVSIPWWPDQKGAYALDVGAAPTNLPEAQPRTFASVSNQRNKPDIEIALPSQTFSAGSVLSGAFAAVGGARPEKVTLEFVQTVFNGLSGMSDHSVLSAITFDHVPPDGSSIPFELQIDQRTTRSLSERSYMVSHSLRVTAQPGDVALGIPLHVYPSSSRGSVNHRPSIHPVGRERRSLVWNDVARQCRLQTTLDDEAMIGTRGPVSFSIDVERRKDGSMIEAEMHWPQLGLELDIVEKSWDHMLSGRTVDVASTGISLWRERFTVFSGRRAQALVAVQEELLEHLGFFDEVEVHDDGCRLSQRGTAQDTEPLRRIVDAMMKAAELFSEMAQRVPPPAEFAHSLGAWQEFAQRANGTLERGRMRIVNALVGTSSLTIETVWNADGQPVETMIRVGISPPLPQSLGQNFDDPSLSVAARSLLRETITRVTNLVLNADEICATIDLVTEPNAAEWCVDALADISTRIRKPISVPFR